MRKTAAALLTGAFLALPTTAALAADITVDHVWARPTTSQAKAGAAFLTLRNAGAEADRLIAVKSPAAERAELHIHVMEGGIARMREVEGGIEVPPGGAVALQPGGLHIMLIGLTGPLGVGKEFPVTLRFEKAGEMEVRVPVVRPGQEPQAEAAPHGADGGHGHGHGH